MAGSILGKDQIEKVNSQYAKIHSHIANLLAGTPAPVDLMRVHVLTEYLDTTELSHIFMELPFLSPAEKRALVRVAIFDVLLGQDHRLDAEIPVPMGVTHTLTRMENGTIEAKTFNPPQFKLNVATTEAHQAPAARPEAVPVSKTPTVLTKLSDLRADAKAKHDVAEAERQEAVAEIRKADVVESSPVTGFAPTEVKVGEDAVSEGA